VVKTNSTIHSEGSLAIKTQLVLLVPLDEFPLSHHTFEWRYKYVNMFQELSKSLETATGKLFAVKCDVSNQADVLGALNWVKKNLGGVDILINNAAVAYDRSLSGKCQLHLQETG
jgi:hypothetical protein